MTERPPIEITGVRTKGMSFQDLVAPFAAILARADGRIELTTVELDRMMARFPHIHVLVTKRPDLRTYVFQIVDREPDANELTGEWAWFRP